MKDRSRRPQRQRRPGTRRKRTMFATLDKSYTHPTAPAMARAASGWEVVTVATPAVTVVMEVAAAATVAWVATAVAMAVLAVMRAASAAREATAVTAATVTVADPAAAVAASAGDETVAAAQRQRLH